MLKLFQTGFSNFKDNFLCIILKNDGVILKLNVQGEAKQNIVRSISSPTPGEAAYLQNIAEVIREELSWLEITKQTKCAFLLDKSLLAEESFNLPALSKKEERDAIAWEVSDSIRLAKDSYYSAVQKSKEMVDGEYEYTVYAVEKSLIDSLAGMMGGFGINLVFIAPYEENKTLAELSKHNFLPEELKTKSINEILTKWGGCFAASCFIISIFTVCILECLVYGTRSELEDVEKTLEAEAFWQENFKLIKAMERKNKSTNATIKKLDAASVKCSKVLEALGRATVPGLWLTSVETEGVNYKITGHSVDMLGLNAWLEELSLTGDFKYSKVLSTEVRPWGISFKVIIGGKKVT